MKFSVYQSPADRASQSRPAREPNDSGSPAWDSKLRPRTTNMANGGHGLLMVGWPGALWHLKLVGVAYDATPATPYGRSICWSLRQRHHRLPGCPSRIPEQFDGASPIDQPSNGQSAPRHANGRPMRLTGIVLVWPRASHDRESLER